MRIAKYFLLLILLFGIALMVFVFTQNGNFEIKKTIIIANLDKKIVYNYLEDFKNWNDFINDFDKSKYNKNQFYWKNQKYTLIGKFKNDSLHINYTKDENDSKLKIEFEKQNKSTKLSWNIKGNYTYKEKFLAFFYGNNDKNLTTKINNYLTLINNNLQKEHFYFKIKYEPITLLPEQTITYKTINCSISNQEKEISKNIKLLQSTLDSLNVKSIKKPFIIYNWKDFETQNTQFKICLEISKFSDSLFLKNQVFIKPSLHYQNVKFEGNKKYLPQFWNNFAIELEKRNLIFLKKEGILELINENNSKNNSKINKKSDYKTQFLIPIIQIKNISNNNTSKKNNKVLIPKKSTRDVIETLKKPEIKELEKTPTSNISEK
jgi:hypothetical protein